MNTTMTYPKLSDLDTSHPQVGAAVQVAHNWAREKANGNPGISMILSGRYGVGKTHLAKAILWSIRYSPEGLDDIEIPVGRFFLASKLIIELGPFTDDTGMLHHPSPDYFAGDAPIIVLDDVGGQISMPYIKADRQKEEIQARYFLFVDHCLNRETTMWIDDELKVVENPPSLIITTNLDLGGGHGSEFAQHVGGRVWDRLQVMCPAGFMIGLDGVPSWRQKVGGR